MEDRKRLEAMVNELNMYQGQADVLNQQVETVKATISDLNIASETLETIKDKKDTETLVPIGAQESVKDQKKDLEALLNKMMVDLNKITDIIVRKTPEAEALIQKLEGTKQ